MFVVRRAVIEPGGDLVASLRTLSETFDHVLTIASSPLRAEESALLSSFGTCIFLPGARVASSSSLVSVISSIEATEGQFDEVIVTDDGWVGPIAPLEPLLATMSHTNTSVWTMTEGPDLGEAIWWQCGGLARLRADLTVKDLAQRLLMPGEIFLGEARVAFPRASVVAAHPIRLIDAGCPLVDRACFTTDPLVLSANGLVPLDVLSRMCRRGFDSTPLLRGLTAEIPPRQLNTTLALMSVVVPEPTSRAGDSAPVLVFVHVDLGADVGAVVSVISELPSTSRIVVATAASDRQRVADDLANRGVDASVRSVLAHGCRVLSMLQSCADELRSSRYDLVIATRAGAPRGATSTARDYRERQTNDALFKSAQHLASVLRLFQDPQLGLIMPPAVHIGSADLGGGWRGREAAAESLRRRLGIRVPLGAAPLEPPNGGWIGRVSSLKVLLDGFASGGADATASDAPGQVLEALLAHAVAEAGFSTRTVIDPGGAAVSDAYLNFTLDQLASTTRGSIARRVEVLNRMGPVGRGGLFATMRTMFHSFTAARSMRRT